jgi:hypothetical protein
MKMDAAPPSTGETGYFFVTVNLLVGIVILTAAIGAGVTLYGILQFIGH